MRRVDITVLLPDSAPYPDGLFLVDFWVGDSCYRCGILEVSSPEPEPLPTSFFFWLGGEAP